MAKSFKAISNNTYIDSEWTTLYTYTGVENKAILLSFLCKNLNTPSGTSDVNIEIKIVNSDLALQYSITKGVLSAQREYCIDRTKQFFVLYPGWRILANYSASGIVTYASFIENIQ